MNYLENHYLSTDGLSLYYRQYGHGDQVIICLPGLTRNSKDFHDLATHLASSYRVICLDLRGRGRSDHDPKWRHYHPGTYVQDTWKLMDKLEINKFIVIGTSLGGLMAMIMSAQQPQRLKAIIMNDIGPEIDPSGYARILSYVGRKAKVETWQDAAAQCKLIYAQAAPDMPEAFWNNFARNTYRLNDAGEPVPDMDINIGHAIRKSVIPARILTKLRKMGLIKSFGGVLIDPWDSFQTVVMPCLVLRGEISDILSADILERMAAIKPDMVSAVIPNRGHAPMLNEPESIAAIDTFLDGLPNGKPA